MQFPLPDSHTLPESIVCASPPFNSSPSKEIEKIVGSLVGLAVGDALGSASEFRPHQYLLEHLVTEMQGGGTWGLQAGQWTDDTSMALCLASSLITQHGYNPYNQMVRYKWWFKKGFLSSTGECFDIGKSTRAAIEEFVRRQNSLKQHLRIEKDEDIDNLSIEQIGKVNFDYYCGEPNEAGNGALMRLAPVPLFYFREPELAVHLAGDSARLTHGDQKAVDACRYYAALIVAAMRGASKEQLLDNRFFENHQQWFGSERLHDDVLSIAHGSYKKKRGYDDGIRGKNYIIDTLEAALWAFWSDEMSFKKGACNAVNLGDDTDTTAAVYGQLAGAYYGISGIPQHWIQILYAHNLIICVAEWLYFEGGRSRNEATLYRAQKQMTPRHQSQPRTPASQTGQQQQQQRQEQNSMTPQRQSKSQTTTSQHSQQQRPEEKQMSAQRQPQLQPSGSQYSQQQQQQKMTAQRQSPSQPPATHKHQNYNPFASNEPISPRTNTDRMGYDASYLVKQNQNPGVQNTSRKIQNVNPNPSNHRQVKTKQDPSIMPAAGLPSGYVHK